MIDPISIVRPQAVTSAWLTEALQCQEIDAHVSSFKMDKGGTGQLGETRRFHLSYTGAAPKNAPTSLVGKFPSNNEVACKTGKEMGFYRAELMFYREAAHRAVIRTPEVYVAEFEPDSAEFTLLLEDLAPAQPGDHMSGRSVEVARQAHKEDEMLHAA